MSTFAKLIATELRLFLRDRAMVFFVIGLPLVLVVVFGTLAHPSTDHDPMLSFLPAAALSVGLAGLSLNTVPGILATYREKGILRRMSATPMPPSRLLLAELVIAMGAATVTAVLVIVVGGAGFGFRLPQAPLALVVAFVLGSLALFSAGLVLAALAPSGRAAGAVGSLLFTLSIFAGGVFVPRETLPPVLSSISAYTPMGATMDAIRGAWTGTWASPAQLAVMAGYAVVLGAVAARTFRWE